MLTLTKFRSTAEELRILSQYHKDTTHRGAGLDFIPYHSKMAGQAGKQERVMKTKLLICWVLSLLSFPLFSYYGRPLQLSIMGNFSSETLTLWLAILFTGVVLAYGVALVKAGVNSHLFHLLWIGALALAFYLHLPFVEKIHIALFGLFGFLSLTLFEVKSAALFSVAIAFLDELFQHFLAARVGDWRDVWLNLFSASLGMFLALLLFENSSRQSAGDSADDQ